MTQETWTEISADDKPARAKHTPGPWQQHDIDYCPDEIWGDIEGPLETGTPRGVHICTIEGDGDQLQANAKLIAAAPTMLAVLHQVSRHFAILAAHGTPVDVTLEDAVHEAIDNAGGY